MGRINEVTRFFVTQINILAGLVGMALLGLGVYVLAANWGNLDPSFFFEGGIIALLFGFILSLVTVLGCLGVMYQIKRTGWCTRDKERIFFGWTGRQILFFYQFILLFTLGAEVYYLTVALGVTRSWSDSAVEVSAMTDDAAATIPPLSSLEKVVSRKFNTFFFSAVYSCTAAQYSWFWSWVNSNCPTPLTYGSCYKCHDYALTSCEADKTECYGDSHNEEGPACPYMICRSGILTYFEGKILSLTYFVLAFVFFQVVLLITNCMLICYTKAASETEQLQKAGSLSTSSTAAVGARVTAIVGAVRSAVKSAVVATANRRNSITRVNTNANNTNNNISTGGVAQSQMQIDTTTRRVSFTATSQHVLQRKESV